MAHTVAKLALGRAGCAGVPTSCHGSNMIPNALAVTGPYAGLWSHLKSMDHALARALDSGNPSSLTALDKERLEALVQFFQRGLVSENSDPSTIAGLASRSAD